MESITYLEAIREALADSMREDERVFMMGEDIGHFGGPFGVTKGLADEFGENRIIDTPISEEGFVGAALGAAWMGERPIVELQFADFISTCFDQLVTVAAKTHWRSGISLPFVLRAPFGGGIRGGPFHASCPEGWFIGTAGLKVVSPSSVPDAYGLLRSAIEDENPVIYFEHKGLYRSLKGEKPESTKRTPIGKASIVQNGNDLTILTYGASVKLAIHASEKIQGSVEILDLCTLWPLDEESILQSIAKTSRVLVLQEASSSTGVAGHVLSLIAREAFGDLDAPPALHAPIDTPVPFAPELEDAYLPSINSTETALNQLLDF